MPAVKINQNKSLVFEEANRRHTIDSCLPQRQAIESGKVGFHALSHGHYPGQKIRPRLLPGVPSLGYFDVIGAQDWGIPPHRNEGIEICYQQTGESTLTVDGKVHRMAPHALSLTRPWQLHSLGDPHLRSGRLFWIILDVGVRRPNQSWTLPSWCVLSSEDGQELIEKLRGNEAPVWAATSGVGQVFAKLGDILESNAPEYNVSRIRLYLNELLLELLELLRAKNVEVDPSLMTRRRVVEIFLNELKSDPSLLSYPWTLESMARQCGMGRTSFADLCRELLNTSPMEALVRWRLAFAAEQLRADQKRPITTIAFEVGFSSSQYFSAKFRKQYGMSPRQWRAQ